MKSFLPWLLALGLLGGGVFLFSSNQKLAREVVALREESSQALALRAELGHCPWLDTPLPPA